MHSKLREENNIEGLHNNLRSRCLHQVLPVGKDSVLVGFEDELVALRVRAHEFLFFHDVDELFAGHQRKSDAFHQSRGVRMTLFPRVSGKRGFELMNDL